MTNYKEYIYAVYQEKSFSKAAKKLYVSQPWLSATIKKAEQELGLSLFDRSTNPISLTEAGRYYIERIEQIMAIEAEMEERFKELQREANPELRIGTSMFFCTYVLPALLNDFSLAHPEAAITFVEGSSKTLTEKLLDGRLDFLLEAERPESGQITSIPWASEEIVLAVPACDPINGTLEQYRYSFEEFLQRAKPNGRRPSVPLAQFKEKSFILLKEGNDIYGRVLKICRNAGFDPQISLRVTQMMTAYYLVCEGQGITFLRSTIPQHVVPTDQVVFYQLDDPLAVRDIYLSYTKRKASPMQQELIEFMKDNIF